MEYKGEEADLKLWPSRRVDWKFLKEASGLSSEDKMRERESFRGEIPVPSLFYL